MATRSSPSRIQVVIAGAALCAVAGSADAACNASISDISPVLVPFNPFDGLLAFQEFRVTVVNGGADACTLSLAIKSDATGSERKMTNGANSLVYVIKTDGGVQMVNDLQAPAGLISLPGGGGAESSMLLRLEVPAGQTSGAGSFTDKLTLRLFDISGAATQVGPDKTAAANGFVPARAQINLAGGDAAFGEFALDHLDFGELQEGETRDAAVQVRSTAPVTVTVLSQNGGVLKHKILGDSVPSVPYSLTLAGEAGNLAVTPLLIDRTPRLTLSGENYPLRVVVGPTTGRVAGQYQDVLTISVVPADRSKGDLGIYDPSQ